MAFQLDAMARLESTIQMIDWFKGRKLPECPFVLKQGWTVTDAKRFVDQNMNSMVGLEHTLNRGIGINLYKLCYLRLYELKKYIETNEQK